MTKTKGEETKDRIIKTAVQLVHTRGYKNTSLDDIFAESGINKGSFYFHFSSKDELVHEVIDRFSAWIERRLELLSSSQAPSLDKISAYLQGMSFMMEQSGCTGGCLLGNLTLEVSDWHEGLRNHLSQSLDQIKGRFATIIADGQRSGEIRTDRSAEDLAAFLLALTEGALMLARAKKDIEPFRGLSRDAVDFLSSGTKVPGKKAAGNEP